MQGYQLENSRGILGVVQEQIQALEGRVKVAEIGRQSAEERAVQAEQRLQNFHSPTPTCADNENTRRTLEAIQAQIQALKEQLNAAEADKQLAQERAAWAEQRLESFYPPTTVSHAHDDNNAMQEVIESQGKGKESQAAAVSDDEDDEVIHSKALLLSADACIVAKEMVHTTVAVQPPMKFSRPRAGAGPLLKATFKPKPLFAPSPSPEPSTLRKAVSVHAIAVEKTLTQRMYQPATLEEKIDLLLTDVHKLNFFGYPSNAQPRTPRRLAPRRFKPAPVRNRSPARTMKLVSCWSYGIR